MPQLVKGGKYIFGWSKVGNNGEIRIPPEAYDEYNLKQDKNCILFSGSKTSGGFGLSSIQILRNSIMKEVLDNNALLANNEISEGEIIKYKGKMYCWTKIHKDGSILLSKRALQAYGIKTNDKLLSVRGSHLAIGFITKGPIFNEANNHNEIEIFE